MEFITSISLLQCCTNVKTRDSIWVNTICNWSIVEWDLSCYHAVSSVFCLKWNHTHIQFTYNQSYKLSLYKLNNCGNESLFYYWTDNGQWQRYWNGKDKFWLIGLHSQVYSEIHTALDLKLNEGIVFDNIFSAVQFYIRCSMILTYLSDYLPSLLFLSISWSLCSISQMMVMVGFIHCIAFHTEGGFYC